MRLVEHRSIFDLSDRVVRYVEPAATVAELVDREWPGERALVVQNGRRLELDDELDGGEVVVRRLPQEPTILAFILEAVITAIIAAGVGYAINALLLNRGGPAVPEGPQGSNTYSFSGMRIRFQQGEPVPVVYGEHRIAGQVVQQYRRNGSSSSVREYLYMLLALGHGPVEAIGQYDTNQNQLVGNGEASDDFNGGSGDLDARENWEILGGTAGVWTLDAFGNHATFFGASEHALYFRDDVGLRTRNCYVEAKFVQGQGNAWIAINMRHPDDGDPQKEMYGLGMLTGPVRWELSKVEGGTTTQLATGTAAANDVLRLERSYTTLTVYRNGSSVHTEDISGSTFTSDRVGVWGNAPGGITQIDDFVMGPVRPHADGTHINGMQATAYREVDTWLRLGEQYQDTLGSNFSEVVQGYAFQQELDTSWTEIAFREEVVGFDLVFDFPGGLYDQSGGAIATESVEIEVEYREDDGDTWTPITGSPFTYTHDLVSRFSRSELYRPGTPLEGDAQQIRVRRTSRPQNETDSRVQDRVWLGDVNEYLRDDRERYGGIVLVAVRARATERLNSSAIPNVTSVVQGVQVPVWDGTGDATKPELEYEYSSNPAWIALDILLNQTRGVGNDLTIENIDLDAFKAWADWCDEELTYLPPKDEPVDSTTDTESVAAGSRTLVVDGTSEADKFAIGDVVRVQYDRINTVIGKTDLGSGRFEFELLYETAAAYPDGFEFFLLELGEQVTEKRHTFNGVFDTRLSRWEALLRVCRVGRAVPVVLGTVVSVRYEDAGTHVQVIHEANVIRDSMEVSYNTAASIPDLLFVQYLDAATDYDQATAQAGGFPPRSLDKGLVQETVNLYGITSATQATREAHYHLRARQFLRSRISFEMAPEGLAATPGDIIRVAQVFTQWATWAGRGSGTPASFRPSHDVVLESGIAYRALVRTAANPEGVEVMVTAAAGTYTPEDEITTDSADTEPIDEAPILIGTALALGRDWRIVATEITPDLTVRVEAVRYEDAVYELQGTEFGETIEIPPTPPTCIDEGTYFVSFEEWGLVCETPDPECVGLGENECCRFSGTITVAITGDAEPCVEIVEVVDGGVIIRITSGCEGDEFCVSVTYDGEWNKYFCGCEVQTCLALFVEACDETLEACWTVCA